MNRRRALAGVAGIAAVATGAVATAEATSTPRGGGIQIYVAGSLADSGKQPVVISGAFADAGQFIQGAPASKVVLSRGTFLADDAKGAAREGYVFSHLTKFVDAHTCAMDSYTQPVTLSGGTGAYRGLTGTLKVHTTDTGVFPRLANGHCNLSSNARPIGFLSIASGSGHVRF